MHLEYRLTTASSACIPFSAFPAFSGSDHGACVERNASAQQHPVDDARVRGAAHVLGAQCIDTLHGTADACTQLEVKVLPQQGSLSNFQAGISCGLRHRCAGETVVQQGEQLSVDADLSKIQKNKGILFVDLSKQ